MLLALPEGHLHRLAPDDFLIQLPVRGGQHFDAALRVSARFRSVMLLKKQTTATLAGGQGDALDLPFVNLLHADVPAPLGKLRRLIGLSRFQRVPETLARFDRGDPPRPED